MLLRDATDSDMELVLAWRNNPQVWAGTYTQSKENRPLTWEEHFKWWRSRYNWQTFIIQVNDDLWTRDVGYLNIGQLDNWNPEISIYVGETLLWGQGIGSKALKLAINSLKEHKYNAVHTTILKNNERAIRLFRSLGFTRYGEARENEYEVQLRF